MYDTIQEFQYLPTQNHVVVLAAVISPYSHVFAGPGPRLGPVPPAKAEPC